MVNFIILIISLIFAACCTLLELAAKLFGWTYTEACVYINLYLQYGIMMLSTLSIVYVAARKMTQGFSTRRAVILIASILYNIPFAWLGAWLYRRYGKISCEAAFALCRDDLLMLGTYLDIPNTLPYYTERWTEYYIVNLIIFIVLYLLVLFLNWGMKRMIKKHV